MAEKKETKRIKHINVAAEIQMHTGKTVDDFLMEAQEVLQKLVVGSPHEIRDLIIKWDSDSREGRVLVFVKVSFFAMPNPTKTVRALIEHFGTVTHFKKSLAASQKTLFG